jgi:hypothetical protein
MRFSEFASAQDQLALWKLISDNTWSAMNQLQRREQQQRAAQQRANRFKTSSAKLKQMAKRPATAKTSSNTGLQTVSPYLLNPSKNPTA